MDAATHPGRRPAKAAASGGNGELVSRCGGSVCFTPGDSANLVAAVDALLSRDPVRIGRRGRSSVARAYSWRHTFRELLSVYGEILFRKTALEKAS